MVVRTLGFEDAYDLLGSFATGFHTGLRPVTHGFSIEYCGNLAVCRTEARILRPSAEPHEALVALVYDTSQGMVVDYFASALPNPSALPGLAVAVTEARAELQHYINRRGENRPKGITRPGLSLWLTERDDETVMGIPHE
jgi:hypothetical protein